MVSGKHVPWFLSRDPQEYSHGSASAVSVLSKRLSERQPLEMSVCETLQPERLHRALPLSCALSFWHRFRENKLSLWCWHPSLCTHACHTSLSSTHDIRGDFPQQKHVYLAELPLSLPNWPESMGVPDTLMGLSCGLPLAWSLIMCQVWLPTISSQMTHPAQRWIYG